MSPRQNRSLEFAFRICKLKADLGLKQKDFARALQTEQGTVSKWLNGKSKPFPDAFVRLSRLAMGEERAFFLNEAGVSENYFERSKAVVQTKEGKALDAELLAFVIEAVEAAANMAGVVLPRLKYAAILARVYDSWREAGQRDCAIVD
jgi:transcriptional regulator with XRE-family HTH domain